MVSSCSHVTSFTNCCCHNTFTSLTVLPCKTCSLLSMIRTGPSSRSHLNQPQALPNLPRVGSGVYFWSMETWNTACTLDKPCPSCDTNCHTPTFSAQRVRRLTHARLAFSRSILSHGIVLDFLIVAPSHVKRLDLARHRPA